MGRVGDSEGSPVSRHPVMPMCACGSACLPGCLQAAEASAHGHVHMLQRELDTSQRQVKGWGRQGTGMVGQGAGTGGRGGGTWGRGGGGRGEGWRDRRQGGWDRGQGGWDGANDRGVYNLEDGIMSAGYRCHESFVPGVCVVGMSHCLHVPPGMVMSCAPRCGHAMRPQVWSCHVPPGAVMPCAPRCSHAMCLQV